MNYLEMIMKGLFLAICLTLFGQAFAQSTLPQNYTQLSADQKRDILWSNVVETEYALGKMPKQFPLVEMIKLFNPRFLVKTFQHQSDELPKGRIKTIHAFGSVAKIRLNITHNTPYEGLFKSGAIGIARASLAAPEGSFSFTPGIALKFLVDGKQSLNIFAMDSLDGQGKNRNYFAKTFSNELHFPKNPALKLLARAFDKAVKKLGRDRTPMYLPLTHLGQGGLTPAVIKLVPAEVSFPNNSKLDLRDMLSTIKAGTVIYKVFVSEARRPDHFWVELGEIVTESEFIPSRYGDEKLFFQHH
jgi:hypothetical protein